MVIEALRAMLMARARYDILRYQELALVVSDFGVLLLDSALNHERELRCGLLLSMAPCEVGARSRTRYSLCNSQGQQQVGVHKHSLFASYPFGTCTYLFYAYTVQR